MGPHGLIFVHVMTLTVRGFGCDCLKHLTVTTLRPALIAVLIRVSVSADVQGVMLTALLNANISVTDMSYSIQSLFSR